MFKKRQRKNIRTRKADNEEKEEEDQEQPAINGAQPPTNSKPSIKDVAPQQNTTKGILSFDDELTDVDSFKVKKTNISLKMARQREKEKMMEKEKKLLQEVIDEEEMDEGPSVAIIEHEEDEGGVVDLGHHLQTGMVPDATMIHAIRKKREMAREMGVASVEYIPLDSRKGGKMKGYGKAKGKSRLIREDEHDKSDEDEEGRVVNFGTSNEPGRQMQVLTGLENIASDSDDEETKRWEEEMINKGMKASNQLQEPVLPNSGHANTLQYQTFVDHASQSYSPHGSMQPYGYPDHSPYVPGTTAGYSELVQPQQIPVPSIPEKLVPITLESLRSKLLNRLQDLKDTHQRHTQQLEQLTRDAEIADEENKKMEDRFPVNEGQYAFFQQMRSYVRDLLSCLAVKNPVITALDQKMVGVYQKKAEFLMERRRQDVIDETEECASGGKGIVMTPEVEIRQRRSIEREARRRRRREKRHKEGVAMHEEGMSSDDELLEANRLKFVSDADIVRERLKDIFSDVVEDFHRLYVIKTRFEQWKFSYPETYDQAFVSMCLPKLFVPFVTLQMIGWNPLENSFSDVTSMQWFKILIFYGHQEGVDPVISDEDNLLIPSIIDKVILPKLTSVTDTVFDPLSTSQTNNLVKVVNEIFNEYTVKQTPQLDELLSAINKRIQKTINTDVFIPLMSSIQLQNNNTRDYVFYQRQFWNSIKLLSNILSWRDILPDSTLQHLVLDGLVSRYLLLSLQNSPADKVTVKKTEKLFSLLPRHWFDEGSLSKPRPIQGLRRFLGNLRETLQREGMGSVNTKKTNQLLDDRLKAIETIYWTS